MSEKLSIIDILNIINRCSLSTKPKNQYMLEIIDNMVMDGCDNPFADLEDDSLKRIFGGSNPFPRDKASFIYSHMDEDRFIDFLRKMGDTVIYNIEKEIQSTEPEYELDETCFNLQQLIYARLKVIANKPRKKRTGKSKQSTIQEKSDNAFSVIEYALVIGEWEETNRSDTMFIEELSGMDYKSFSNTLIKEKNAVAVNYPVWAVKNREERVSDLCLRLRAEDIRHICDSICNYVFHGNGCSTRLLNSVSVLISIVSNNTNALYDKRMFNGYFSSVLEQLTGVIDNNPNCNEVCVLPLLSEINFNYSVSIVTGPSVISSINSIDDVNKFYYQIVLLKASEYDRYFISSALGLFQLAERDEFFYNSLLSVFIGWCPRTEASVDKKAGVMRGLLKRNPVIAKQLIFDLLPGGQRSVVAVPDVLYSERPQLQNVTYDNYWKYESVLLDMLFNEASPDKTDYIRLIRRLSYFPESLFDLSIKKISTVADDYNNEDRLEVLEQLSKLVLRNDLNDKAVDDIQQIIESHNYSFIGCLGKELFSYTSIIYVKSSRGIFRSIEELNCARISKCRELYDQLGAKGIISFLYSVEDKYYLGKSVFKALKLEEIAEVVKNSGDDIFMRGLASQIEESDISAYIESGLFDATAKYMTLGDALLDIVNSFSPKEQRKFWTSFDGTILDSLSSEKWILLVKCLANNKRYDKTIIEVYLHRNRDLTSINKEIYDALMNSVADERVRDYMFLEGIDLLRSLGYDNEKMILLEIAAVERYVKNDEHKMLSVHKKMAENPLFFVDVVERRFRHEGHYYRILDSWETVPGLSDSGFDFMQLTEWYAVVKNNTSEVIFSMACLSLGKSLFNEYEKNRIGFLNSDIAQFLDEDDHDDVREGFFLAPEYAVMITSDSNEMPEYDDFRAQSNDALSLGLVNVAGVLERIAYKFFDMYSRQPVN